MVVTFGDRELVIRRRYETLSIVNDILIAMWFIVGSVLFLSTETAGLGTWLFIAGSVELLIRPAIRLTRNLHLQRLPGHLGPPPEATQDF
nr:YrhK family protein [Actinomycetospora sp. NBRC 106375]